MKDKIFQLFSAYFGLVIGVVFAFALGIAYAVLKPNDPVVSSIILISLVGWLIYIIRFVWDALDRKRIKPSEKYVKVKIYKPTGSGGKEEVE